MSKSILIFTQDFEQEVISQKIFSEATDPDYVYRRALLELFSNPPPYDHCGKKWGATDDGFIWNQIQEYIFNRHPDLKTKLEADKIKQWFDMIRPVLDGNLNFSEKNSLRDIGPKNRAADIMQRITVKICLERGCSFSEAFAQACLKNPATAKIYYEEIHGR